ncbi:MULTISPECIES: DMT family transporter [Marinobacter]|uniref:DMT family transporter n=1 Tax=Marinobacter TaxID=2742 RepID=UPI000DAD13E1|nr:MULTISPECIES: SMR family transporter [Marinobacter]
MQHWLMLAAAICFEVVATSALKASEGFSRLWPSVIVVVGYGLAFYFLAITLRTIPVGIAYAVWAGAGVALITLIGWLVFGQAMDLAGIIGILLIVAGVMVLNIFSSASPH